jgi:shikimate kinase
MVGSVTSGRRAADRRAGSRLREPSSNREYAVQPNPRRNIVLIGMPGAGKSTVGVILAKHTSRDFVDTDVLIQTSEGRSLQKILDEQGHLALRAIEERILLSLDPIHHVIATGGSAAYSGEAMRHLKKNGIVVFLHVPFAEILERVRDFATRGIARAPDQSFADLFDERYLLYKKYADLTIACEGLDQEQVSQTICRRLGPDA